MLRFTRGDSVEWPVLYKVRGVPVDLSTYLISAEIRAKDGTFICALSADVLDQAFYPGRYILRQDRVTTAGLRPGSYFFDIQYTSYPDYTVVHTTSPQPLIIDPGWRV